MAQELDLGSVIGPQGQKAKPARKVRKERPELLDRKDHGGRRVRMRMYSPLQHQILMHYQVKEERR